MPEKVCACNRCPYGPGEDDLAPEKPMGFRTPDTFCGIAEQDEEGAFIPAFRQPVYFPEGEKCNQLLLFEEMKERRFRQEVAA